MNALPRVQGDSILPFDESADQRLGAFLKLATRMGWEIVSYDHIGIQLKKRKRYGAGYFFVGALTAILGIGILVWIAGWIDYAVDEDRSLYIPRQDLMQPGVHELAELLL